MTDDFTLVTPEEIAEHLGEKAKVLRLARKWKQVTLAERSGVSLGSLQRFERKGLVSLQNLLKIAFVLGRLSDFESPLVPPPAESIAELEASTHLNHSKRGAK